MIASAFKNTGVWHIGKDETYLGVQGTGGDRINIDCMFEPEPEPSTPSFKRVEEVVCMVEE